jgi:uncharacterized membrane protein
MTTSMDIVHARLNDRLARLLGLGSWASCIIIACGMALPILGMGPPCVAAQIVSSGIVLLIALPTMRVATMSVWFLFHRDLDFALIAAGVLLIIIAATLSGVGAA